MPVYKITWEFTENNGSSFSEVYYATIDTAADAVNPPAILIAARLALLHPLNTLARIRASNIASSRDTNHAVYQLNGQTPAAGGPNPVGGCAVLQLGSAGGGTRKLWLRGIPGNWYVRSGITGQDLPPPAFTQALTPFFNQLVAASYGIVKIQPLGGQIVKYPIITVDGSAKNGVATITTAGANTLLAGMTVQIARASKKDLPYLNGRYTVISAPPANTFTIPYNTPQGQIISGQGAYVKQIILQGSNTFSLPLMNFDHYGTRTSKSPLFHSRGAKRASRGRLSL